MTDRPIAWACRACNKISWADVDGNDASLEHVSYRGMDIGTCKGKMVKLALWEDLKLANEMLEERGEDD